MESNGGGCIHSKKRPSGGTTDIHVLALDEVMSVNTLFTAGVFLGMSLSVPSGGGGGGDGGQSCAAGIDLRRDLIVFEVVSFSCFLFSSLVAQGLKLAINLINSNDRDEALRARVGAGVLRLGMLAAAAGSVGGAAFLLLSMVHVVQVKLGLLSCGGAAAVRAVAALVALACAGLALYVSTLLYAVTH